MRLLCCQPELELRSRFSFAYVACNIERLNELLTWEPLQDAGVTVSDAHQLSCCDLPWAGRLEKRCCSLVFCLLSWAVKASAEIRNPPSVVLRPLAGSRFRVQNDRDYMVGHAGM